MVRGIAILLVLGQHTPAVVRVHPIADAVSDHLHHYGYLGVDVFFVLSGFLIGGLLFGEFARTGSLKVGRFLTRRAFKIWPSYLVCLTACCLATGASGRDASGTPTTIRQVYADMWPAYLHVQNYFASTARFIWFWSLGVEEHFYLVLPLVLLPICRDRSVIEGRSLVRRAVLLGIAVGAGCLCLRGWTLHVQPKIGGYTHYFPTHLRIDALMAGVLLAAVARFAPARLEPLRPWRWLLAAFALGLFVLPTFLPGRNYEFLYPFDCTLLALGSTCVVLVAYFADLAPSGRDPSRSASEEPKERRHWISLAIAFIGFYSYPIYLWHAYFGPAIARRVMDAARLPIGGTGSSTVAHLVVYVSVSVALGIAAHWAIERPFLKARERFFPSRASALVPTAPSIGS